MRESEHPIMQHHRHPGYFYPVHIRQRIYELVAIPLVILVLAYLIVHPAPVNSGGSISPATLIAALFASIGRLLVAYAIALALALPLALLINANAVTERILLPLFDILQSVPVLAFFPVIIIFFVNYNFLEGAAVFVIFISMLWSLVFSLVGGLRLIPEDIKSATYIYHIRGLTYLRRVLVPSVFPYFVTGSLLAFAGGWNILIVAEVLHTYLPHGSSNDDLFGIGSVMVHASAAGHGDLFLSAIITLVVAIALINLLVWQRLLRYAERYRFE